MAMRGFDRVLWLVVLGLLAAIAGVAVYKAQPLLNPKPALAAPLDPACDLRLGSCAARFPGGGELIFEILPSTLPVLAPLTLRVEAKGLEAYAAEVDFAGVDMNMGFNRVSLTAVGGGRFEGSGMLPTCVRDRMDWEATVLLQGPAGLLAAPFRFQTTRQPR